MKCPNIIPFKVTLVLCGFFFFGPTLWAAIRMHRLFSDGLVLQRNMEVPVWGWSEPGQTVNVCLLPVEGKTKKKTITYTATADASGKWQVRLPAMRPMGPLTLQVSSGEAKVVINDVWVGDVWVCSGQSNIDTNIERVYPQYSEEIDQDLAETHPVEHDAGQIIRDDQRLGELLLLGEGLEHADHVGEQR